MYMLGVWCYEVTILPWYQRQIASKVFATPPTSSYEEALQFCERAEKVSPNFYRYKSQAFVTKGYHQIFYAGFCNFRQLDFFNNMAVIFQQ